MMFLPLFAIAITGKAQITKTINISNPLNQQREDELVVLKRDFVEKNLGMLSKDTPISITKQNGSPVFVQFDDLDKDGNWDELAFLYTFKPKEKVKLDISNVQGAQIKPLTRAHVRQMRKNADDTFGQNLMTDSVPAGQLNTDFSKVALPNILTEGPAWENDKVGFRIYMDVRNTKDIWGKTTSKMMMDEVGVDPKNIYHHKADWGMDILAVGQSLGAGSLAFQVPFNGKDTLVRLGGKNMGPIYYRKLADGPIRAVFTLNYPKWQVLPGLAPVNLTEKISISGGQYFYQSEVKASNIPANAKLVTGIVNLKSTEDHVLENGNTKTLYTYGKQSENDDNLGLAIAVADGKHVLTSETPKTGDNGVVTTYTLSQPISDSKSVKFRFYSAWEDSSPEFKSEDGFVKYLKTQTANLKYPLKIK